MDNIMTDQPKKILVLDDNEDILEMLKEVLLSEGYEAEGFSATEDVIKLIKQVEPDLVMLDYLLSGINGGEYCHQIKTNPETSHMPVIMLSAHQRVIESLGNYGWDAFIAKPFSIDELINTIKDLLKVSEESPCSK